MIPEKRLPEEEYLKIKEQDMAEAQAIHDFIQSCNEPLYVDRNQHPVMDLKHVLQRSAELYGDDAAFYEKPSHREPYQQTSFKETKKIVDALGTSLVHRGFSGKRLAVIGENGFAWASAYLAIVCGTGIVIPLDKELNKTELKNLINIAEVSCIFYTKSFAKTFLEMKESGETGLSLLVNLDGTDIADGEVSRAQLIEEGEKLLAEGDRGYLDAQVLRHGMGILLFTSGTTGVAKGVMLSHENICTDLMIPPTIFEVRRTDIFFSVLPLHHTYECTCGFLVPFYKGAAVAYCEGLRYITDNMEEIRPTVFLGVPLLFENLYKKIWQNVRKQGKEKLLRKVIKINRKTTKIGIDLGNIFFKQIRAVFGGRLRQVICGGAAINPEILDGIRDFGIESLQGYGLTECAPICALNPQKAPRSDSAGYLIPGFDGYIDEPDPETGIGEICVTGTNVMLGYYNEPEATAAVLIDGWFHTGDYGYIDKDRYVYITGRKKNIIITKTGKNVFPEELEYYLACSDLIDESMAWEDVASHQEDTLIAATVRINDAFLQDNIGENPTQEEISKFIWDEVNKVNSELPYFKKIKKIYLREEEFEQTTSKKIRRTVESNKEGREV